MLAIHRRADYSRHNQKISTVVVTYDDCILTVDMTRLHFKQFSVAQYFLITLSRSIKLSPNHLLHIQGVSVPVTAVLPSVSVMRTVVPLTLSP